MAIFRPGERHRYHNILSKKKGKRDVTALLSLTAMVDMFTVLVIFLLQNYNATGEILYIPKDVVLPKATSVRELKPAHVITISSNEILLDRDVVATFDDVKGTEEWLIPKLKDTLAEALVKSRTEQEGKLQNKIRDVVETTRGETEEDPNAWSKVTIQADKGVDFLTVKKVLFTVTEAGAGEINFAVTKLPQETNSN
ncbi:ExbD/TolR family protein [Bdellovibrio bacteriovorus]|uniref:Adventurous gliding motility protein S n=1 Tax=Bdellovibrio bacteriovorus str. Tiberius TaxID=1069642 RepID=K7Z809_BDEBC|nr:biopolymer transporter ExbD [Bdellovibrio bacteriovorus]AFY00504.1 adventurous gliding motility protein S [Bdellovibrio bacteriovorus str. Tiberius]